MLIVATNALCNPLFRSQRQANAEECPMAEAGTTPKASFTGTFRCNPYTDPPSPSGGQKVSVAGGQFVSTYHSARQLFAAPLCIVKRVKVVWGSQI